MKKILIVGAGFFGAVLAERIATDAGLSVAVIDKRDHVGGNSWSETDKETGVEYHKYGSHIFHTSDENVWRYINQFTSFNEYRHTVWTTYQNCVYSLPINLGTINSYYRLNLSPVQAKEFIANEVKREHICEPQNLEEKAISLIGRPLYEAFIKGYTAKQWEVPPSELAANIITRLPVRYTYNNRYFSDKYEGIPVNGYGKLFARIFDHPRIDVRLETNFEDCQNEFGSGSIICFTGPIDRFFQYKLGRLEWRTVDFELERHDCTDFQGTSVMNYADTDIPYTRIHEFKHYHPEREPLANTLIFKEFSRFASAADDPYYPVDTEKNRTLFAQYKEMALQEAPNVIFGGRLGSYKYMDMDDTIAAALQCYKEDFLMRLI